MYLEVAGKFVHNVWDVRGNGKAENALEASEININGMIFKVKRRSH